MRAGVGVAVETQAVATNVARVLAEAKAEAGASAGGRIHLDQSLGLDQNLGPILLGVLCLKAPTEVVDVVICCNGGISV